VLPALIAGNAVVFKPSPQTPLTAERFALALTRAGVPATAIQVIHMSPALVSHAVQSPHVQFVSFTGSVPGGHAVERAAVAADNFKGVALEVRLRLLLRFRSGGSGRGTDRSVAWWQGPGVRASGRGPWLHRRRARGRRDVQLGTELLWY
jgi:hypothetical protein